MKGYFNQYEASHHLVVMTAMLSVKAFLDGNCITDNEREALKKVMEGVDTFSKSVFNRLGDGYVRSLKNKASMNTLRIVSKDVHHKNNADMADFIDSDFLRQLLRDSDIDCCNCTKTDCLKCKIYKVKSYLHYDGVNDNTGLCPFRLNKIEAKQIEFGDDL